MTSAALAGSTGLVGSHILTELLSHPSIKSIHPFTRRDLPTPSTNPQKLSPITSPDSSSWPSLFPRTPTPPQLFISALGTTKAVAGSLDAQRKIDVDLNYSLAKAAKAAGVDTYVLISTGMASSTSRFPYTKMKGELEDLVKGLGFKNTVILRPGYFMGERDKGTKRGGEDDRAEALLRPLVRGLGWVSKKYLVDTWALEADTVGKAAVRAAVKAHEGTGAGQEDGVWVVEQKDILALGKDGK